MSDSQTVWTLLWNHALRSPRPRQPFEIDEVLPELVAVVHLDEAEARRLVLTLLKELARLPEGKRFFTLEGNAVVPLGEFVEASRNPQPPLAFYPYEL
jgi:hypothetical protein